MFISRKISRLLAVAALVAPAALSASPLPTLPGYGGIGVSPVYPGPAFDWPAPFVGYAWFVDIAGVDTVPTPVIDFTVTNTAPNPVPVMTFQAFGNCDGTAAPWKPGFTLFIDDIETPWTNVDDAPCGYHDYLDFVLPLGETRFTVLLEDAPDATASHVDVRFGDVIPAVPLPPAAALLMGGIAALGLAGRRQRAG
ncbi:hypothetical protein ACVDG3_02650 [Meridianimarinicoccus sp. RP-17]|uniref:hypothetical protein n=1 Tax=Meridianimarinicoccus zhengii TaxID=2056810 RepID=UPI000DAE03AD|nr:hypothetical protein [Phycocomes zhengii]